MWIGGFKKPEDMAHEAGPIATNSEGTSRLAQVLARKSGCNKVDGREGTQLAHVSGEIDARETSTEHSLGARVDLIEQHRLVACMMKSKLYTADTSEESNDPQADLRAPQGLA